MPEMFRKLMSLLFAAAIVLALAGCREKTEVKQTPPPPPVTETNKSINEVVTDTSKTVEHAVGTAVTKTSDGVTKGAQEVERVATNTAGQVKTGVGKFEDKLKEITK
jgi:uncharacterized lipoprotein YajG